MPGTISQPQPALDHLHPRFQALIDWPTDTLPFSPDVEVATSPHAGYLLENGFLAMSEPNDIEYLNNPIHPIFLDANWLGHRDQVEKKAMTLALQLASKFITDETMAKWWTHLAYGRRSYNTDGRVYLAKDPREDSPEAYQQVQQKLTAAAEKIKFLFVSSDRINSYSGFCCLNLEHVASTLESSTVADDRFWYNPWANKFVPSILVNSRLLYDVSSNQGTTSCALRCAFNLATTLVHEVAHACVGLWQQDDGAMIEEPLCHHDDYFAECGYAWEQFAFGLLCGDALPKGRMYGTNVAQLHPKDGLSPIPIRYLIPDRWVNRWFDQKTWASMTEQHIQLRDSLQDHDAAVLMVSMKWEDTWSDELYRHGERVPTDHEPVDRFKHFATIHFGHTVTEIAENYRHYYLESLDDSEWLTYTLGPTGQKAHYARLTYISPKCRFRHLDYPSETESEDASSNEWHVKYMKIDPMALKWYKGEMTCGCHQHWPKWTVSSARSFSLRGERAGGSGTKHLEHASKPSTRWISRDSTHRHQEAKKNRTSLHIKSMEKCHDFLNHRLRNMNLESIAQDTYRVV
ncbi:hypothetical protein NX059_000372 [Plenodomus lindquistii]|nr:hypothetical protein NX059_000372 [Plenodomus lindquistii]